MRKLLVVCSLVVAAAALSGSPALAAPWVEAGDAPDGPGASQDTVGLGSLDSISGIITRGSGDHVDTYCIQVVDPSQFFASTWSVLGGSATTPTGSNADTRLWLWTEQGGIVIANDDSNGTGSGLASTISDPSTFTALTGGDVVHSTAAGIALVAGQKYLLSISEFPNDPEDASNVDLVNMGADFDALHGPNPAAGAFNHWENTSDTTTFNYLIAMRGASFCTVPEPGSIGLLAMGALALVRRRR